jgi:hypothetical protein
MVPHDARRILEDQDSTDEMEFIEHDDPLIAKNEQYNDHKDIMDNPAAESSSSDSINNGVLFGDDLEIKPEVDTGRVSESCFSFKKLWTYMGPGKASE